MPTFGLHLTPPPHGWSPTADEGRYFLSSFSSRSILRACVSNLSNNSDMALSEGGKGGIPGGVEDESVFNIAPLPVKSHSAE
ncbi:MAG: hypothetical protein PUC50_05425 [Bacteroidales bacterium]|nr:hypothetical protein [Bacteroidales bacterium]